jgi:hypothetical protein
MRPEDNVATKGKRARDLVPGDVIHDPPWSRFRRIEKVTGPWGSPPWVEVHFYPVGVNAYGVDEWVQVVA